MGMYTKLILDAPLKYQDGIALNRCINTINNLYKSIYDLDKLATKVKDVVPFGMDASVAVKVLLNNEDNLFYSQTQVHFSQYNQQNTTLNDMLRLTVNTYIRNYDHEIERFLTALAPRIISNYTGVKKQFLGSIQSEEADVPLLIFHDADTDKIVVKQPQI